MWLIYGLMWQKLTSIIEKSDVCMSVFSSCRYAVALTGSVVVAYFIHYTLQNVLHYKISQKVLWIGSVCLEYFSVKLLLLLPRISYSTEKNSQKCEEWHVRGCRWVFDHPLVLLCWWKHSLLYVCCFVRKLYTTVNYQVSLHVFLC